VSHWEQAKLAIQAMFPGKTLRYHIVWIQGERESPYTPTDPVVTGYAADLERLIVQGWRAVGGLNMAGADVHIWRLNAALSGESVPALRTAQASVAATVPNCYLIDTDDAPFLPSGSVHYSSAGYYILARKTAASILATIA
jgi:hypothetical protein